MTWHNVMKANWTKDKTAMKVVKGRTVMVGRKNGAWFATEALCRHMRWPLAYGGKITDDGCVRCPLHQTTHRIDDGSLVEWAPFPLVPKYGELVGKLSRKKDLKVYATKVEDGRLWVDLP